MEAVEQPQPGEWWQWINGDRLSVMWCSGRTPDGMLVWHEDEGVFAPQDYWLGRPIRHLPDCTGFDYVPPPEETPAEKRLREVGVEFDDEGDYLTPSGQPGVKELIQPGPWTPDQLEAIAAHMRATNKPST